MLEAVGKMNTIHAPRYTRGFRVEEVSGNRASRVGRNQPERRVDGTLDLTTNDGRRFAHGVATRASLACKAIIAASAELVY